MKPYILEEQQSDDSRQSLLHQSSVPSYNVKATRTHIFIGSVLFLIVGIAPQLMENALFSEVRTQCSQKYQQ
jgi:hypothetical protein